MGYLTTHVEFVTEKPDRVSITHAICRVHMTRQSASGFEICQSRPGVLAAAMRITGGQARGIPLMVPKGDAVRPATDGMRQAVFSSIGHRVPGAWFLDLFAGSGAYGLEALSRGAAGGVWVEKNRQAAESLRKNLAAVTKSAGRSAEVKIVMADATAAPWPLAGNGPDIVFIDPPYEIIEDVAAGLFVTLTAVLAKQPDPLVVFEMPGEIELAPPGWTCAKRLGKGAHQPSVGLFLRTAT